MEGEISDMSVRVLFQGDSITDAARSREREEYRGSGYLTIISARMGFEEPGKLSQEYNLDFVPLMGNLTRWQKRHLQIFGCWMVFIRLRLAMNSLPENG